LVIWSFGQNRFLVVKILHYNKYFIFIYSEQMTQSENENDHFDLDHFDHLKELREANDLTQEQTAPTASPSRRVHR